MLRLKAKLGEITMANELLAQKIAALEGKCPLGSPQVEAVNQIISLVDSA